MLIRLYGPVELDTGQSSHRIAAPKLACVLAALAASPEEPVSMADLITRVWGTDPPDSAISTVYSYIARLRAMLRQDTRLSVDHLAPRGYVLRAESGTVDVHRLRELTATARRHRDAGNLAEAVTLWRQGCELARGEALVGVGGHWAAEFRAVLRAERLQLLTDRYTAELDLGHHADAASELAELVTREPLFEPLTARYLLALYRCGRAAEALDRYEELRIRLRDHSGADPSAELRGLHQAILRQDVDLDRPTVPMSAPMTPASRPAVPAQLPADAAGFHGRDVELAAIVARSQRGGVVVIDGMAGVGKTALALRAAHRLVPEYPDGQLFVDLHGYAENVAPTAPGTALARLLRALDAEVGTDDVEELAAVLRTALSGRRMLLVLDNARDAEQVRPLLPGTADCLTIVTSRRRLVELVDTQPVSLSALPITQAAELFAAEADVDADAEATRVAELCGGLPLALRIAASRLRHRPGWDTGELAKRLSSGRSAIRELDGAGRGVAAAFELSYQELDPVAQRQFRLLSVFPGSVFNTDAAAALTDVDPADAEGVLEQLVDAQLLSSVGATRYRMHDLLREYATALVDNGEREAAWRRLAEYYLAMLHAAATGVNPRMRAITIVTPGRKYPVPDDAVGWIQAELAILERLTGAAVADGNHGIACDLSLLLLGSLINRFSSREIALRIAVAGNGERAALALGDQKTRASMLSHLGAVHKDVANYAESRRYLNRALQIQRDMDDAAGEMVTRARLADTELWSGRFAASIREAEAGAAIADANRQARAAASMRIGTVWPLCRLGRVAEAEANLRHAHTVVTALDARFDLMRVDHANGILALEHGDHAAAAIGFQATYDYSREHQIPHGMINALSGLAVNATRRGEFASAAEHAQNQLELLGSGLDSPNFEARALRQLGSARTGLGEYLEAQADLLAALKLASDVGADLELADTARALGDLHHVRGETADARRYYDRALAFYTDGEFPDADEVRQALASLDGQSSRRLRA